MPIIITKARLLPNDPILLAAQSMEPRLRKAFLDAIALVKSQIIVDKLREAIEHGNVDQALAIAATDERLLHALQGKGLEANITSFKEAIQDTYLAGAKAALLQLPTRAQINLAFDMLNPESVNHLQTYTFSLIQEVTQTARESVRQTILRAFREGGHPYEQAREIREAVGLTARMEQAVANYRKALENGGSDLRTALSRSLRDGRYDRTLLRALISGEGLSKTQIDRMVSRYRERYIQYRARNIARTETARAATLGQQALWRQAMQQGVLPPTVRRRWIVSGDERTCPQCMALDGETVGLEEEFEPGVMGPPDPHPSCRCTVALDSKSLHAEEVA